MGQWEDSLLGRKEDIVGFGSWQGQQSQQGVLQPLCDAKANEPPFGMGAGTRRQSACGRLGSAMYLSLSLHTLPSKQA